MRHFPTRDGASQVTALKIVACALRAQTKKKIPPFSSTSMVFHAVRYDCEIKPLPTLNPPTQEYL